MTSERSVFYVCTHYAWHFPGHSDELRVESVASVKILNRMELETAGQWLWRGVKPGVLTCRFAAICDHKAKDGANTQRRAQPRNLRDLRSPSLRSVLPWTS